MKRVLHSLMAIMLPAFLTACGDSSQGPQPASASPPRVRLLTADQYYNALRDVFGQDVAEAVVPPIPPLQRTDGLLASGAASAGLTSDQLSQIQQAASTVATMVVDDAHRSYLIPCQPAASSAPDPDCASAFLSGAGKQLFGRPLTASQQQRFVDIANSAAETTADFYGGLALALEAMLISPGFLLHSDQALTEEVTTPERALDAYSLASRLSLFLWNTVPDAELLQRADSGELLTNQGLADSVDRMLASPRLEEGMRAFFDDMLAFDEFNSLAKDANTYPAVTGRTLADAREQTLRTVIDHLLTRERDYRDLFTTRDTFMSPALAAIYGVPAEPGWSNFEFPESSPRHGLLTHVSFLAANSHSVRSSPTLRGKALRELLLCQHVPEPPPNVDFSKLEEAENAATARERLAVHNSNPSCAGCHLITDPMGLALENFDGAGVFRETENGADIDISGELDGVFFDDVAGLAVALRDHPKLSYCLVNRLYAYASGGAVSLRHDRDTLKWYENRFAENGFKLRPLLREIVMSAAFRNVRSVTETANSHAALTHHQTSDTHTSNGAVSEAGR
jgi:hypothetical protein